MNGTNLPVTAELDLIGNQPMAETSNNANFNNIGRWVAKLAGCVGFGMAGGIVAAHYIPAEVNVGPHRAEVTLTHDGNGSFDLGPIGSLVTSLEGTYKLGARVEIKETPSFAGTNPGSSSFSEEDVEQYASFFRDFEGDISDIKSALIGQWLKLSGIIGLSAAAVSIMAKTELRAGTKNTWNNIKTNRPVKALVATGVVGGVVGWSGISAAQEEAVPVSEVFEGTALEGVKVRGRPLEILINTYAPQVMDFLEKNDKFYDQVYSNLEKAFEEGNPLLPDKSSITLGYTTDFHCNAGMMEVAGKSFNRLFKVNLSLDGGDITMSGTELEDYCVRVYKHYMDDITDVIALGNHDDLEVTGEQLEKRGSTLLKGEVIEKKGLTILGDSDPRRSIFGQPKKYIGEENVVEMGERLADAACKEKSSVDIMLVHEPDAATETLERGCARLALTGHMHKRALAYISDNGEVSVSLTGASAGGADHDRPTLGPLNPNPENKGAEFYIIKMDKASRKTTHIQVISISPDASVVISSPLAIPKSLVSASEPVIWPN